MPAPATPPTTPVARLRNPGELLAALPYLIGFHPRDSLLFIAFGGSSGRRIELTQRVDLPGADDAPAVCRPQRVRRERPRPGSRWSWWAATRWWPAGSPSAGHLRWASWP